MICTVADRIGSQEEILSKDQVESVIFSELEAQRMAIAAQRAFPQLRIALAASLTTAELNSSSDISELTQKIEKSCSDEISKAHIFLDPSNVQRLIGQQLSHIDEVIGRRDLDAALKFLPAKELLRNLAPRAGCRNSSDLMRALSRNFHPEDFVRTSRLREALLAP